MLNETHPENWDNYDTVYIGYPIWWGIAAWPVNQFVTGNDFTGKAVIPFCTSASSGLGQSGELLAEDCDADVLFLLTAVEHVAINFGKPNQEELEDITADEAERLADEGQFGKGSMEPKVRAAIKFARSRKGRTCIIGALDKAAETMAGLSGTRITA